MLGARTAVLVESLPLHVNAFDVLAGCVGALLPLPLLASGRRVGGEGGQEIAAEPGSAATEAAATAAADRAATIAELLLPLLGAAAGMAAHSSFSSALGGGG